ncbi:MAG: electron transport complex subunit RsxC [Candidatus Delongbacteria bacterium]|nr:electron transport complex subunit RsxC [Candidatus Delongbacteria bacterium]MCG2760312.1 electron transport complex subunit RsxC [Candidatus Delongbacteria bacterium]
MKYTFKGGYHPPDGKRYSEKMLIEKMPSPKIAAIHLHQHIGAPSKAIVNIGDEVKVGQPISEPGGFVSVPVHASISGKVKAIAKITDAAGNKSDAVIIESDGKDELFEGVGQKVDYYCFSADEIKKKIASAGIAGMGGARFPTHVKLSPPAEKKIDYIILNGVECEPYLTADDRLMQESPDTIIEGLKLIMKAVNAPNGMIGIEKNKPDAIRIMKEKTESESNIKVIELEVKYPQGGEKQLIYAALGKEVPSGGLPMDIGVVVSNVGTANAVYEAIALNKPLYERIVSVTGESIMNPKNLLVRIGTPTTELIEYAGGLKEDVYKVVNGGPMMGAAMYALDAPVHKGTSGILCLSRQNAAVCEEHPCISCGKCVTVCPLRLLPTDIQLNIQYKNYEQAEKLGILDCILCGTCAYVCPAKRNLVHYYNVGKAKIAEMKKKK